ncbi:hypothetical protein [Haloarcula marina]|uniref:hypothetical protein n=1 Tax=Haloarcula marina TaxID=2961574 RepID=UPI0020B8F548|nr:hypothetical protein [Halomicroarcula marina]
MTAQSPPAPDDPPPKATLFCPACDHRSHVDGDWLVRETARGTRYRCPDCRTELTHRPAFEGSRPPRPGTHWPAVVRAWGDSVRTWQALCQRLTWLAVGRT